MLIGWWYDLICFGCNDLRNDLIWCHMLLVWLWYDVDTVLIWCRYDVDMMSIWCWNVVVMILIWSLMSLIWFLRWFGYDLDMMLIWLLMWWLIGFVWFHMITNRNVLLRVLVCHQKIKEGKETHKGRAAKVGGPPVRNVATFDFVKKKIKNKQMTFPEPFFRYTKKYKFWSC